MNVYDFDETILKGDSEDYFFIYASKVLKDVDQDIIKKYLNRSHVSNSINIALIETSYKEVLRHISDLNAFLDAFWSLYDKYIKSWYIDQKKADDVIISATPRFILEPIAKKLGVKCLIATIFDVNNYKVIGKMCYKEEKVNRYKELYPNIIPNKFYSDSDSDLPMAKIAKKAYKVEDDLIKEWKSCI